MTSTSGFDGIYEFAGDNSSADAHDPALAGVDLIFYWSQLEPTCGVINWALIDHDMAPWIAAGKKVILRVSTSGGPGWDPPYSGSGTPAWVYSDGVSAIHDNGSTLPEAWDPPYLADYRAFILALGQRYDGDPAISFVEPGIGMGGETLAETNPSSAGVAAWEAAGYSDGLWLATVEQIASWFASAFPHTPVYPMVDRSFFDGSSSEIGTLMAWFRSHPGWGLQDNGLTATQTLGPEWSGPPLAAEERDTTIHSGDSLAADITRAVDGLHARFLLLYRSDLIEPANRPALLHAAAGAGG